MHVANYQTALMRTLVAIYNGGDPQGELTTLRATLEQQQAKAKAADQACGVWGDTSA